ncbi:ABC transporter substrate-binding protein [Pendulispora albinea]|uniref:ABC transporter substrate-binding protein n=1 Tax=Pendulispora albinea TaxID=2741071 RepID=A0ABZ2M510_9BACT
MSQSVIRLLTLALLVCISVSCRSGSSASGQNTPEPAKPPGKIRVVFKYQPLGSEPEPLRDLLADFERANPDIEVMTEVLPNASDVVHQYFLTSLEGKSREFDVFIADVVWIPEFARAGWISDISDALPPEVIKRDFLPGAAEAVIVQGKTYGAPWYVDAGLLYYRTDLVPRAPKTYEELIEFAKAARAKDPSLYGYVWQGRQYEGLVCNAYEALWGHGGKTMDNTRVLVDTKEGRAAMSYMRRLFTEGISPPSVTSAGEEDARHVFQQGRAVFMRNWPYCWGEAQKDGSPIKGKVGITTLPTVDGSPGHGALGGWQLALNANTPSWRREAALKLMTYLTSLQSGVKLAIAYGRNPSRKAAYQDADLRKSAPFVADLLPVLENAKPRPVTPYYGMLSDVLQSEFSAVVSGIRTPEASLDRAQKLLDHVTQGGS